jgi:subtilase family serine protease
MNTERNRTLFARLVSVALGISFLGLTLPGLAQESLQVLNHHVRSEISSGKWLPIGSLPSSQQLHLSIVLPLRNQDELTSLLGRLSDPSSPDYHQFLSVEQFVKRYGPTAEDYAATVAFAQSNGFTVTDAPTNRMLAPIKGTVAQIERTFHVSMKVYQHPTEGRTFYSPNSEPALALSVPVAHIVGLNNFLLPRPLVMKPSAEQGVVAAAVTGSGPGGSYLASDMRAAYYTSTLPTGSAALTGSGQAVGLVEFDGYNISDVSSSFAGTATSSANGSNYLLSYTPTAGGTTYTIPVNNVLLDGATGAPCQLIPSNCQDAEQALDIVQAIGMAPGLSQVRVYIGSYDVDILNAMASENIAQQLSISWEWSPDDPATDDFFFQEFAAQGQSIFAASGDSGAYDPEGFFSPYFYPAEDAWVTTVGGTDLVTNGAGGAWSSETAWYQSGGGISPDGIPTPSWQAGVANSSNNGSTTLRNEPDVAAEADIDNYDCNMGTCQETGGGTSFAAPRWAGFMALINQQSVAAGNSSAGFVNPAIYAIGAGSNYNSDFHDIISGNNDCCSGGVSFNSVTGYDLVTGWGSPAGQDLIDALAPPASLGFHLSTSPSSLTINSGASSTTTITVTDVDGFAGSVNLSISGLPSGITASFGTNPANGSSVLTLTVSSTAIRGSYLLTISGTSGSLTATTTVALTVNAQSFSISSAPGSLQLILGSSGSSAIEVTDYAGFAGSVALAVTAGLPSGVTASWVTNPTTGNSLLILTASTAATPFTDAVVTITGTSGALSATTTIALTLTPEGFLINVSPYPFILAEGGSATATVDVVPRGNIPIGSAGSVTLSAVGLASGVSASFNPNPTTTGTSVLTMTASNSASLGTSEVYIIGNSPGVFSGQVAFQQTITATPTPTFTVATSLQSLTVAQGGSVTNTIKVTYLNGFTGAVTLTGNAPLGATVSITPNPTTGTSLLTLNASSSTATGVYWLNVTGTSGTLSVYANYYLMVTPPPSFTLAPGATLLNTSPGTTATTTIAVNGSNGFNGSVALSASGVPSGMTASFSPNPTTGISTLTVTDTSAAPGTYNLTITGASGTLTTSTNVSVVVSNPSISINDAPGALTISQGASGATTVTLTYTNGSPGDVPLTISALPSGVTASFSPNPITSTSVLTLTASPTAARGTTMLMIIAKTSYESAGATLFLTINPAVQKTFTIEAVPNSLTVHQGEENSTGIIVTSVDGFNSAVRLRVSGLPAGVTTEFSKNAVTPRANDKADSRLHLIASDDAAEGTATVTVTGSSGSLSHSAEIALTVEKKERKGR